MSELRDRPDFKTLKTREEMEAQLEDVMAEFHEKLHEAIDTHFELSGLEDKIDELEAEGLDLNKKDHPKYAEYDKLWEAHTDKIFELGWAMRDQAHLHTLEIMLADMLDNFQEKKEKLKVVKNKNLN